MLRASSHVPRRGTVPRRSPRTARVPAPDSPDDYRVSGLRAPARPRSARGEMGLDDLAVGRGRAGLIDDEGDVPARGPPVVPRPGKVTRVMSVKPAHERVHEGGAAVVGTDLGRDDRDPRCDGAGRVVPAGRSGAD